MKGFYTHRKNNEMNPKFMITPEVAAKSSKEWNAELTKHLATSPADKFAKNIIVLVTHADHLGETDEEEKEQKVTNEDEKKVAVWTVP